MNTQENVQTVKIFLQPWAAVRSQGY